MEEPREETEREALRVGRMLAKGTGVRVEGVTSDGGVVHHFIAGANENIHRLLPPLHPCSVGMTEGCKETSKKKKERASDVEEEKENRKGRDI